MTQGSIVDCLERARYITGDVVVCEAENPEIACAQDCITLSVVLSILGMYFTVHFHY